MAVSALVWAAVCLPDDTAKGGCQLAAVDRRVPGACGPPLVPRRPTAMEPRSGLPLVLAVTLLLVLVTTVSAQFDDFFNSDFFGGRSRGTPRPGGATSRPGILGSGDTGGGRGWGGDANDAQARSMINFGYHLY